jgi:3-deoxy-D-manno-octulosonic-acid transferase
MSNFRDIVDDLARSGGCIQGASPAAVESALLNLIDHPDQRKRMSALAQKWHGTNQGATERTDHALEAMIKR